MTLHPLMDSILKAFAPSVPEPSFYQECRAAGLVTGNHESDLYLKDTPEAREICKRHDRRPEGFQDQRDGSRALDVPFAYEPFWEAKQRSLPPARQGAESEDAYLDALEPRTCACGASTGSVALDTCGACGQERATQAARALHQHVTRRENR